MKRKAVLAIMLTLLFMGILSFTFDIQQVEASGTIYIRADGSIWGTTDIMTVDNVTYTFTANINDSIVVERNNITIDGAGYTVQGTGSGTGIDLSDRSNVTLKNVEATNFYYGIYLNSSSNNTLSGNTVSSNNYVGIYLNSSSNNTITGNTVSSNNWHGICLLYSSNNVLVGNTVSSNHGNGIHLYDSSNNNVLVGNTVSSNSFAGIDLYDSSNNVLSGNTASNNYDGIRLLDSSNNTLTSNNASNNQYNFGVDGWLFSHFNNYVDTSNTVDGKPVYYLIGVADAVYDAETNAGTIYLINSNNITIKDLTLTKNYFGALFFNTTNSKIENVTASNNYDGIWLGYSSNNVLVGNTVSSNNYVGIYLLYSSNNVLVGNTVSSNNYVGIYLSVSSNNVLVGNTASNNTNGIYPYSSSNNVFFHNNLIGNTVQASVTTGYVNTWDDGYPSGGNYWSNYTGVDLDHDGIGDTEHVIDANNTDNYPLMGMFSDFKATSEYHVQTICNSTISDFQYNGTAISFNVTGENDTTGFCRICIPRALMNETYQVFVNGTEAQCNLLPCSNTTHSYLYFTYNHSTQEVVIVPEFPTWTSMLLILIVLSVATAIYKRRLLKTPIH